MSSSNHLMQRQISQMTIVNMNKTCVEFKRSVGTVILCHAGEINTF